MASQESSCEEGISMNNEPYQRFSSPPPKPPRRRHSDQSSKLLGAAGQKKNVNSSLMSISKETRHGSESLPADWVPAYHNDDEMAITSKSTDNQNFLITDNCDFNSSVPKRLENHTVNLSDHLCEDDNFLSISSSSTWPIDCDKLCISFPTPSSSSQKMLLNCNNPLCSSKENEFKCNHELKGLLHRHHSDPSLSKYNQSFSYANDSNSFLNAGNVGSSADLLLKDFKCPHLIRDSCLMSEEARVLKERNDKLWKHMCSLQRRLDTRDSANENVSVSFSDLMHDIYQTQKEKDNAIEKRIKAATDERDSAVQELEEVLKSITGPLGDIDSGDDEVEQQELKQLFKEIDATQNPVKLLQQQRILLSCLYHAKESKLNCVSHQLKIAIEEKEHALEKASKLEDELMRWKSSRCLLHSEAKQWEAGLVEALCQAISQRDSALSKVHCFQEQIKSLKIQLSSCQSKCHSFEESHSSIAPSKSDSDVLVPYTVSSKVPEDLKDVKMLSQNHLDSDSDQVRLLKYRVTYLTNQLDGEIKRRQEFEDKCHKLERILCIMNKKLNGVNVGVSV